MIRIGMIVAIIFCSVLGARADKPNVLFIAIDDLNDWVGCLGGHPQALTPNIDRLAARGMLFTNAHCAAPACTPSRTSLFTGQMPQNTGVWANKGPKIDKIRPDAFLLPMSFSASGYRTLGTGKLGPNRSCFETFQEFEQRWSPLSGKQEAEYTSEELPSKGSEHPRHVVVHQGKCYVLPLNGMPSDRTPDESSGESFDWGPFDVPDSDFGDTKITDWAITRLKEPVDQPWFLGVGYYRPHQPLWAPQRFFDRFENSPGRLPPIREDDLDDLGDAGKRWALTPVTSGAHSTVVKFDQWQAAIEAYLACVTYVDHEIGRLLDVLDQTGKSQDTLIVLWSDHGWHLGEKQHWGKWTGWERATKVPLIMVPPKSQASEYAPAGSRCDQPVNLIDIYPTLVEICDVTAPPHDLDGRSLVPLMRRPDAHTDRQSVTMFNPGNGSLRTERWRYIRYADGTDELYDLEQDPNEWDNLSGSPQHKDQQDALRRALIPYVQDSETQNPDVHNPDLQTPSVIQTELPH